MNYIAFGIYLIGRRREQALWEKRTLHLEQRLQANRGARWAHRFWPEGLIVVVGRFRCPPVADVSRL